MTLNHKEYLKIGHAFILVGMLLITLWLYLFGLEHWYMFAGSLWLICGGTCFIASYCFKELKGR